MAVGQDMAAVHPVHILAVDTGDSVDIGDSGDSNWDSFRMEGKVAVEVGRHWNHHTEVVDNLDSHCSWC